MAQSGIYKIQSIIKPERIYIGSAIDIKERWIRHRYTLNFNKHRNIKLQRHYNKYGKNDLKFSVLELCLNIFLIEREQYYIDKCKPYFNICKIAQSHLGIKRSEETKVKISLSQKGKKRFISWMKGKHHSEEAKKKLKEAWIRRKLIPVKEETKKKISFSLIGNNRSKGKIKYRDINGKFIKKAHN